MNIHNELYMQYVRAEIGAYEILSAYDKGYIDEQSCNTILGTTPAYTLEQVIAHKSKEFSYFCEKNILNGVIVKFDSGAVECFSLSAEDQINLNSKMLDVLTGMEYIEYHADGQPSKMYSNSEMRRICVTAQTHKDAEICYRNNLREWIKQLTDVEEIRKIVYGTPIPEEYWTEGWRSIQEKIEKQKAEELKKQTASSSDEPQAQSDDVPVEEQPKENILTKAVNAVTGKTSKKKKSTAKEEPTE